MFTEFGDDLSQTTNYVVIIWKKIFYSERYLDYILKNLIILILIHFVTHLMAVRIGAVRWGNALQAKKLRVRFPMVSEFLIDIIRPQYGPGVDTPFNRNWYQGYLLGGGKGVRCVELITLPPSCAYSLKICDPQPPGTLWAYVGIAVHTYLDLCIPPPNATTCSYELSWFPSWLWR